MLIGFETRPVVECGISIWNATWKMVLNCVGVMKMICLLLNSETWNELIQGGGLNTNNCRDYV